MPLVSRSIQRHDTRTGGNAEVGGGGDESDESDEMYISDSEEEDNMEEGKDGGTVAGTRPRGCPRKALSQGGGGGGGGR